MPVGRQNNILSQQRLDVPVLRALESASSADFDVLAGGMLCGGKPYIIRGFTIPTSGGPVGKSANLLQLDLTDAAICHPGATESGTIFATKSGLVTISSISQGSFTPSSTNYIGVDLLRVDGAEAQVPFLFPDQNEELFKEVPTARILTYQLVINLVDFNSTPTLAPIAKVVTDSNNNVVSLTDCTNRLFRLGTGGASPNPSNTYSFGGTRSESSSTWTGGDKNIGSQADFNKAVMTRIWEIAGGPYWYSPFTQQSIRVIKLGSPNLQSNQSNFKWTPSATGTGTIAWSGLKVVLASDSIGSNTIQDGSASLSDGYCLYVDLDFTTASTIVPSTAAWASLGSPSVPGSRFILAYNKSGVCYDYLGNVVTIGLLHHMEEEFQAKAVTYSNVASKLDEFGGKWSMNSSNNMDITYGIDTAYGVRTVAFNNHSATNTHKSMLASAGAVVNLQANQTVRLAWKAKVSATANESFYMGLANTDPNTPTFASSATRYAAFSNTGSNWVAVWQNSGGSGSTGSTAVVTSALTDFTIELYGAHTAEGYNNGGVAVAKFYIANSLVGTATSYVPSGESLFILFGAENTGAANPSMTVGPVTLEYTQI